MTFSWSELANAVQWLLLAAALLWIFYGWRGRKSYRRTLLGLAGLSVLDLLIQLLAMWLDSAYSPVRARPPVFTVFVLLAAGLGLLAACWEGRRDRVRVSDIVDAALVVIIAGGLGARLYQVLAHLDYYSANHSRITDLAQGGMGLRGGLAAGLLALALLTLLLKRPFWRTADAGAVGLSLALAVGWWGAGMIGANYAAVSDSPFAMDLPDIYGIMAPRLPLQNLAVIAFFLLFLILARTGSNPWQPGTRFLFFLVAFGLLNLALDSQRGDETLIWNGWRIDLFFDLAFAGLGLLLLGFRTTSLAQTRNEERVRIQP